MREALVGTLIIFLALSFYSCGDKASPVSPNIPKPKADVRIAVSTEPFLFSWDAGGYYWSIFNVVLSEHNEVQCSISTVVLEFKDGDTVVATETYSGGTIPANGSLNIGCTPIVWRYFNTMTITVTGQDVNGNTISVSRIYSCGYNGCRPTGSVELIRGEQEE